MEDDLMLTPVDIRHREFSTAIAGFNKAEVREFLNLISNQIEDIQISHVSLFQEKEKPLQEEEEEVFDLHITQPEPAPVQQLPITPVDEDEKKLIGRTLVLAEQTKEKIITEAKQRAMEIIRVAEEKARKATEQAQKHLVTLGEDYTRLKEEKREFVKRFHIELTDILDMLNRETILNREKERQMDQKFRESAQNGLADNERKSEQSNELSE
ncbi:MAG: DivIVA domain-containing protein [Candidatus Cloacimonetes bacterium]|nr:DivIVA domain-containing protein [Candidatus Cloacimonadota bacterium]